MDYARNIHSSLLHQKLLIHIADFALYKQRLHLVLQRYQHQYIHSLKKTFEYSHWCPNSLPQVQIYFEKNPGTLDLPLL